VVFRQWSVFGLFLLILTLSCNGCSQHEIPDLGKIPAFQLRDQDGKAFTERDLQGRVWVADFFFTSCAGACPLLTQRMKGVQEFIHSQIPEAQRKRAKIVSFSVDPERDTPERLKTYAERFGSDPRVWTYLTGPVEEVTRTVVTGFKISMSKLPAQQASLDSIPEGFDVVHGEKFVLVDSTGRIRGYFNSDEKESMREMLENFRKLIEESQP